jgi:hypothetical protein
MPGSNSETQGRVCDGLGSNIVAQYSVGSIITRRGLITTREQVERLGNTGASHDPDVISEHRYSVPRRYILIHAAGTVQSWFEKHEGEFDYPL